MAEPLKSRLDRELPGRVAATLALVTELDVARFEAFCLDGYDDLELTPRGQRIADAMAEFLPSDRAAAITLLIESLSHGPGVGIGEGDSGWAVWFYLPHTRFVSEGTRPRLPWAGRLRDFMADPSPVVELLEVLRDDPSEYVRRSVANNLNDIAKDHPVVVIDIAQRWWNDGSTERRRLVRHALRTLIKAGDAAALSVMGFSADSPALVEAIRVEPRTVVIGSKIRVEIDVTNPSAAETGALVDVGVEFVKANGSTSTKVFKGAETQLAPGELRTVRKTISLAQHSTRTHYPGTHRVHAQLNGHTAATAEFEVTAADS